MQRTTLQAYVVQTWGKWDDAWQQQRFQQHFIPAACQIILDQDQAIGVICVERRVTEIYLGKIELLPAYQGRGIGTALIIALVTEANQQRVPLVSWKRQEAKPEGALDTKSSVLR